jgi:DNA-binding CsgD family transcriptional regulator
VVDAPRPLPPRKRQLLAHLAHGASLPAIAAALGISHQTVKNHLAVLLAQYERDGQLPTLHDLLALYWARYAAPAALPARHATLSPREQEAALLTVEGLQHKQVARRLGISLQTAKSHLGVTYARLDVRGQRELVALYRGHVPYSRMDADGRAALLAGDCSCCTRLVEWAPTRAEAEAPTHCRVCGCVETVPVQGRCGTCSDYWRDCHRERPRRLWRPDAPARPCGTCQALTQRLTRGRCVVCYHHWQRYDQERPERLWMPLIPLRSTVTLSARSLA